MYFTCFLNLKCFCCTLSVDCNHSSCTTIHPNNLFAGLVQHVNVVFYSVK